MFMMNQLIGFGVNNVGIGGNDVNTQLLIHCDGADGGTTFTDVSQNAHVITAAGSGVTHTTSFTTPKFGSASFKSATNGGLTIPDHATLRPGAGDFTIDFWVYYQSGFIAESFYDKGNTGPAGFLVTTAVGDNPPKLKLYNNSANFLTETTGSALSVWTHKAIVRSSGTITIYSGGVANGSVANSVNFNATDALGLGSRWISAPSEPISGNMDEIRFSNVARWTANFTPPSAPYDAG